MPNFSNIKNMTLLEITIPSPLTVSISNTHDHIISSIKEIVIAYINISANLGSRCSITSLLSVISLKGIVTNFKII